MADGQGTADPLELEHMIGYTGQGAQSIQYHPTERDTLVGYIGRLVLIANVHDKHQQEFLHGHNEEVTSLAMSPSGNLIASGQGSSRCVPNSEAMVIVWDWKTRQSIYRLIELNDGIAFSRNSVTHLAFSGDDRFLSGTDDQPGNTKLAVWDMESGQVPNPSPSPSPSPNPIPSPNPNPNPNRNPDRNPDRNPKAAHTRPTGGRCSSSYCGTTTTLVWTWTATVLTLTRTLTRTLTLTLILTRIPIRSFFASAPPAAEGELLLGSSLGP